MNALEILTAPWAIKPEMLNVIIGVYDRHLRGEKADFEAIEAAIGRPLKNEAKPYTVKNGVAVINVNGVIAKHMGMFMNISGGVSSRRLMSEFRTALSDDDVRGVLLVIDSPGGSVDGTMDLTREIYGARGTKPVYALADGMMASAAYWIGSAADKVFILNETTHVGSIGVVAAHTDYSGYEEKQGIRVTEVTAGKYKRLISEHKPLSEEGREYIQDTIDTIYSLFVNDIAKSRGTDVKTVLKNMADGRVFMGGDAIDAGLADGFATEDELIRELQQAAGSSTHTITGGSSMDGITVDTIRTEKPEIAQALIDEGRALGVTEGTALGIEQGATAERERIQAVEAQSVEGHEALITRLKFDGKTTGPEAAVQVLEAIKKGNGQILSKLEQQSPEPAGTTLGTDQNTESYASDEERWEAEFEKSEKTQAEFGTVGRYVAYMKRQDKSTS